MRLEERRNQAWLTPAGKDFHWEHVVVEVLMDIREALEGLRLRMDSLGHDGIHGLIQMAAKEHRRREQVAKAHARTKRKAKKMKKLRVAA